jgi:hypothetical protein
VCLTRLPSEFKSWIYRNYIVHKSLEIMSSISAPNNSNGAQPMSAVQKLRSLLADPDKFIACPGVYDGFTARIVLQEGVDCLYMVRTTRNPLLHFSTS